jgi:hypothetical protein
MAVRPGAGFINRGLLAVFGAAASAAVLIVLNRAGWQQVDQEVAQVLRDGVTTTVERFGPQLASREWAGQAVDAMRRAADTQAKIYPAMLALASLCGLAVAWWLWRRVTLREAQPLRALRDFRFRDELVWLFVLAVALLVLPWGVETRRAGANLAIFMGALYALRGLGVMLVLYNTKISAILRARSRLPLGPLVGVLVFLFSLLFLPMVAATTLVVGLGDTWLDWRARIRSLPSHN